MLKNSKSKYGSVSISLHWFLAILIIGMVSFGWFMGDMPKAYQPTVYMLHKSTGLLILFLMVCRICWISYTCQPTLPNHIAKWQKTAVRIVQYSLYLFLLLMPLSGLLMSLAANKTPTFYGLFRVNISWVPHSKALANLMSQYHTIFAWIIIGLLTVHIMAAIKHHFINKDDVLKTMLP